MQIQIEEIVGWEEKVKEDTYIAKIHLRDEHGELKFVDVEVRVNRPAELNGKGLVFKTKDIWMRQGDGQVKVRESRDHNNWNYPAVVNVMPYKRNELIREAVAEFISDIYERQRGLWDRTGFKL